MSLLSLRFRAHVCFLLICSGVAFSMPSLTIHGTVSDPTGAVIVNAKVDLVENDVVVVSVMTDTRGRYAITRELTRRFKLRVSSPGFGAVENPLPSGDVAKDLTLDISLSPASFSEQVTVISSGTPTAQARLGSTVTSLTEQDYLEIVYCDPNVGRRDYKSLPNNEARAAARAREAGTRRVR